MARPLTRRERLERAYTHQEMDQPGVYVRTSFPREDPTYDALKAYLARHSELKGHWGSNGVQEPYATETFTEPISATTERRVTVLHTPAGDLRWSLQANLDLREEVDDEPMIKSIQDARTYLSLPAPKMRGDASRFFQMRQELGDTGLPEVGLGLNPAGRVAWMCGSENFALFSATDRDVIHELCRREMEVLLARVRHVLAQGAGPYWGTLGQEYIVPPLHGPRDYQDFNVRYDKPVFDLIHEAGGRIHVHCHGRVKAVFQHFLEEGIDVLHPIEPPPMGDITAGQAKAMAGRRMTLEGNIQIADMYEKSPGDIRRHTESLIADAFADRQGLIVCPTASPYMRGKGMECFPRFKAMIDAVLEWRE